MATVFQKKVTRALPADAERIERKGVPFVRYKLLGDIRREAMESWLVVQKAENQSSGQAKRRKRKADQVSDDKPQAVGMAARTRNGYLQAIRGFLTWCIQTERLALNPLARVVKADEKVDRRKLRRAMTVDELGRLLRVARDRPLAEYGRQTIATEKTAGKRAHWTYAPLTLETLNDCCERARERLKDNPEFVTTLERRGRERMLTWTFTRCERPAERCCHKRQFRPGPRKRRCDIATSS